MPQPTFLVTTVIPEHLDVIKGVKKQALRKVYYLYFTVVVWFERFVLRWNWK